MRKLLVLFSFLPVMVFAQQDPIALKCFVKKDTVLLRWAMNDHVLFIQGLQNGYRIERKSSSENKTFVIEPFTKRVADLRSKADSTHLVLLGLIEGLLTNTTLSEQAKKMSFVMLLLGSSTDKLLADYCGLYFADSDVDGTVSYSVCVENKEIKSNSVSCDTNELSKNAALSNLSGTSRPRLKQAYLNWEALSLQKEYGAYWIERSEDSFHFSRVNQYPYLFLKTADEPNKTICDFADTALQEGDTFYYRITGINYFGESGESSNIVRVYVPKSIYGEIHIDSVAAIDTERKIIGKFIPHRTKNEITKYVLLRSDSLSFGYKPLAETAYNSADFSLSGNAGITSGDRYYYKVAAVGVDGDTIYSFPYYFFTLDQIPPAVPQGLAGIINDSGVISINWKLNIENDIRGYRIYRSNSLKEEFVEVTKEFAQQGFFTDTVSLSNLTPEIYYRISAVDLNYNNSKLSTPVLILKPDTIPPVPAVFKDYLSDNKGVHLTWNNSSSKDVVSSVLLRKKDLLVDTLIKWSDTTSHFIDSIGISGEKYSYFILTSDKSQNKTVSSELKVNYETGTRAGVTDMSFKVNRDLKQVELFWKLTQREIYSVQIYRAKNDGGFILYKTLRDPKAVTFIDKDLSMNNTYHYKIKVVYKSGVSSILSNPITIVY